MTSAVDERRGDDDHGLDAALDEEGLDDRYGRRRRPGRPSRGAVIGAALIALLSVLVIGYWGLAQWQSGADSSISATVVSFRSPAPGVAEADLSLTVAPGNDVACAIEVQNAQHLIVGWDVVEIPAAEQSTRSLTVQLRTTQPLDSVLVNRCWIP